MSYPEAGSELDPSSKFTEGFVAEIAIAAVLHDFAVTVLDYVRDMSDYELELMYGEVLGRAIVELRRDSGLDLTTEEGDSIA